MADELHFSTIAQTAELIRSRKLSPVELAQTHLKRIAELDPQLNAFITVTADLALAAGARSRAGDREGQLPRAAARHSVRAEGHLQHPRHTHVRRTRGSARTTFPPRTRRPRSKLREAGAVLLGKLADARVRARRPLLRPAVAAGAQSLEPRAFHRRLVERLRRGASRPGSRRSRSAPTPAARSADRPRTAGSRASCRPTGW